MIFICCNWVSTRWQWSVDLYQNRKEHKRDTIHKTVQKQYKNTEYTKWKTKDTKQKINIKKNIKNTKARN
jgi:hypothetical protein